MGRLADGALSAPGTKAGRLQRICLELLLEHETDGAIPTSIRFLFYELVDRGVIPKTYGKKRTPSQDISDAVMHLRELGLVPWHWINDETRSLDRWRNAPSVYQYALDAIDDARVDAWAGSPAPLILCESRSLAGVLRDTASEYLCPVASTNGQAGGFLRADIAPLIAPPPWPPWRRVLYLGDYDLSGGHIEENTREVLEDYAKLEWERVAITREQVEARSLPVVQKRDNRFKPARSFDAVETEALGQSRIQDLLRARLDALLPEPLAVVAERERSQREAMRELLLRHGQE
jgi:hypothetical protein